MQLYSTINWNDFFKEDDWLKNCISKIRNPAYDDLSKKPSEYIKHNAEEFFVNSNSSWKDIHLYLIKRILKVEKLMSDSTGQEYESRKFDVAICRRLNDSIFWGILGYKKHIINRICLYRERGFLKENNPDSILELLFKFYSDKNTIAIWNDATSFVDVGDIFLFNPNQGYRFIEVKSGHVNDQILNISDDQSLLRFLDDYGQKGKKQLERFIRQKERNKTITEIINNNKGIDPVSGQNIKILDGTLNEKSYDNELRNLIIKANERGESHGVIDQCLWIFVSNETGKDKSYFINRFNQLVEENDHGSIFDFLHANFGINKLSPILSLQEGIYAKTSLPLFLRNIDIQDISNIVLGKLKVLIYFDWNKFLEIIENAGLKTRWATQKESRKHLANLYYKRPFSLGGRIPMVFNHSKSMYLGDRHLVETSFDGVTPFSCALNIIKTFHEAIDL